MSFDFNYKFWVATHRDLQDLLKRQEAFKKLQPIDDRMLTHDIFAELYARYVELVNKLNYIYRFAFQVQKRNIIESLVASATKRMLELKKELQKLELSEFVYVDKILVQRKLVPDDINILRPQYYPFWRPLEVQDFINESRLKHDIDDLIKQCGQYDHLKLPLNPKEKKFNQPVKKLPKSLTGRTYTQEEFDSPQLVLLRGAILQLQSHERARRSRLSRALIKMKPGAKLRLAKLLTYEFTHKPDQTMLIPVRKTRYGANYFIEKKAISDFNYYVKPVFLPFTSAYAETVENSIYSEMFYESEEYEMNEEYEQEGHECEEEEEMSSDNETASYNSTEYIEDDSMGSTPEEDIKEEAARLIQKVWRNFKQKQYNRSRFLKECFMLGMTDERIFKNRLKAFDTMLEENRVIRAKKEKLDKEFIEAIEDEKTRILLVKGPWIMEDISDQIRAWFQEFYDGLDEFHPYPDAIKGGTLLLIRGETFTPLELASELKKKPKTKEDLKKEKEREKAKKEKMKAKLKKEAASKKRKKKQQMARGIFDIADEIITNKNIARIEETMETYRTQWEYVDEQLNLHHEPIMDWISADKFAEAHVELRQVVDELMRIEYELLQKALAKDKKRKYKAPKVKKPKKPKKGGKKKKKELKDITADRTLESLYEEMDAAGLILHYKRRTMDEFIGEYNYCAYDYRNILIKDTPPSLGEIKDVLREFILGFGPLNINKPKSMCLAGPLHTGKKLLVEILATEIDAVMIDLSPEKTAPYADNLHYLLHLINKVSKLLQPTIIFCEEVHRIFLKKETPESKELKYNLLEKDLFKKIVKPIKLTSKVFIVGTTSAPWMGKSKMKRCFQNFLLLPRTDYGTAFLLWRNVALNMSGIPRDYMFTPLAILTNKYTTGDIRLNLEDVLSIRRRMTLTHKPLAYEEFIDGLLGPKDLDLPPKFPPEDKEIDKFNKWYRRVNKLARQRAKYVKNMDAIREALQKKKKKK